MQTNTDLLIKSLLDHRNEFVSITIFSVLAYVVTVYAIPKVMVVLFERGIYGIDINKNTMETRKRFGEMRRAGNQYVDELKKLAIPESLGIVAGGVYLCAVAVTLMVTNGVLSYTFPEASVPLSKANAALNTIAMMLLLGFVDDVLDVRWRYKILLSFAGIIPLIMAYDGALSFAVPRILQPYLYNHTFIYLGPLYLIYMALVCVFCCNSINILAGVNGVEVGQSIVIALSCIVYNTIQLRHGINSSGYILSLMLLIPFVAVSLAIFKYNKYPSKVFVGDSYTYFAGITLAVAGITSASSKTLLLFFIPQLINFVLSLPQLFGIVPCPRHRVPTWNPKTKLLSNSHNYTLLNAVLFFTGDLKESTLTNIIIILQVVCSLFAFLIRYGLASLVYDNVE